MDEDISSLLKYSKVFSVLDEEVRRRLSTQFKEVEIQQNEILFYQGDVSDTIYLLARGKLGAEAANADGEMRILGRIDPGETVGELGVLSNEPRTFTIKALKHSILYQLPAKDFIELCHQYPSMLLEAVHPIISRSQSILELLSTEKSTKHIIIIPANRDTSIEKFSNRLMTLGKEYNTLSILSDFQSEFNHSNANAADIKEKVHAISNSRKSSHRILYILKSHDTPLAKVAFKKVDMIYIVGESRARPYIDHHILDKIHSHRIHLLADPELVLLHTNGFAMPQETADWLSLTSFGLNHHVRMSSARDHQRLMRFIRGKATGLVLSGGGTRGWAHLGAIKALKEARIPIDFIGGTSVGALVAACYAMNESYKDTYERFSRIVTHSTHSVSWRSLTWPAISLFNAKNYTEVQMEVFDDIQIEDLWLPYFCISCNLTTNNEDVHRTGTLWKKTRASSSIPGIIPPMIIHEEIHLDGGLLNNIPIDVMRQFVGDKGRVIGIDLNTIAPDNRKYHFPPILTFKDTLMAKMGLGANHYKFPRFVDMFLRGLFLGSLAKSRQNSLMANIFVSLNLTKFRLLHSNPKQVDRMIDIGYQETLAKCLQKSVTKEKQPS